MSASSASEAKPSFTKGQGPPPWGRKITGWRAVDVVDVVAGVAIGSSWVPLPKTTTPAPARPATEAATKWRRVRVKVFPRWIRKRTVFRLCSADGVVEVGDSPLRGTSEKRA
jgi:hypothetical protein